MEAGLDFFSSIPDSSHGPSPSGARPTPLTHPTPAAVQAHAYAPAYTQAHTFTTAHASPTVHASTTTHVSTSAHDANSTRTPPTGSAVERADTPIPTRPAPTRLASGFDHAPANARSQTSAQASAQSLDPTPGRSPSLDFVYAPPIRASSLSHTHDLASGGTHVPASTRVSLQNKPLPRVPVYDCGPDSNDTQTPGLRQSRGPSSPGPGSRFPSAVLALHAAPVTTSIANLARPDDQPATDLGTYAETPDPDPAPNPQPNTRRRPRPKKQTPAEAEPQWGAAFDSDGDLSDTPSASASNRPIESDCEVVPQPVDEGEPVGTQGTAKGNKGGNRKKVSL